MPRKNSKSKPRFESKPTLSTTDIVIGDKIYRMCFDLGALGDAEEELVAQGYNVKLLEALPRFNIKNTRIMFAASIRKFHPEIAFEDAMALVTLPYVYKIAGAIQDEWMNALPSAVVGEIAANPPKPGL